MTIPTNNGDPPTITLQKGQQVMVIRTPKGMYLRIGEKIIKIKLSAAMMANLKSASTPEVSAGQEPPQVVTLDSSSDSDDDGGGSGNNDPSSNQLQGSRSQSGGSVFDQSVFQQSQFAQNFDEIQGHQLDINEDSIPVHLEDLQVNANFAEDF